MPKYRKKPVEIEATQWFPGDDVDGVIYPVPQKHMETAEAKAEDNNTLTSHMGWIETLEGGHLVCEGDYIITGVQGERYPCKPDIFHETYEPVEEKDEGKDEA